MRATCVFLLMLCGCVAQARAQAPLEVGAPASAFAGGPIHLSKNATAVLRAHYQGDKVPLVPQPFRGQLDTALLGHDWPRVEAEKKALVATHGMVAALLWEQSRFIATGSLGVAELHAEDIAATGSTGLSETAVMLWFYAVAVTLTDGHECADEAAKDAHLDRLRGPAFEPVLRVVRAIGDDRLVAMRDLAIRLETVLAPERNDDTMCRVGNGPADLKPDAIWRPEAAATRGMLPRHLLALASIMRPRPAGAPVAGPVPGPAGRVVRSEPAKPEPVRPVAASPTPLPTLPNPIGPRLTGSETFEAIFPGAGLSLPVLPGVLVPAPATTASRPTEAGRADAAKAEPGPAQAALAKAEPPPPAPATPGAVKIEPPQPAPPAAEVVDSHTGQPNPARFEPPDLELTTPARPANH